MEFTGVDQGIRIAGISILAIIGAFSLFTLGYRLVSWWKGRK